MTSYVPSSWSITKGARDAGPCLICTLHESPPVLLSSPSLVTDWMKKRLNSPEGKKDQGKRQSQNWYHCYGVVCCLRNFSAKKLLVAPCKAIRILESGKFCLWNLESSTFLLSNPESWTLESRIQLRESGIHGVESTIQDCLWLLYMGRYKKRSK